MQRAWIPFTLAAAPFFAGAQVVETPDQIALLSAKEKVLASLEAIPNYTCLQAIERVRTSGERARRPDGLPPAIDALLELAESSEKLRVEVGFVDDKELYSWPGEDRFEEKSLPEMVGFGFTSSGTFATALRTAFLVNTEMFRPAGEENVKGRRALRYDYRGEGAGRGLVLGDGKRYTEIPYDGSLWIDGATFDVLRLRIRAEDPPSLPGISEIWGQLDYVATGIGNDSFLVPQLSRMLVRSSAGVENHDRSVSQAVACSALVRRSRSTRGHPRPPRPRLLAKSWTCPPAQHSASRSGPRSIPSNRGLAIRSKADWSGPLRKAVRCLCRKERS